MTRDVRFVPGLVSVACVCPLPPAPSVASTALPPLVLLRPCVKPVGLSPGFPTVPLSDVSVLPAADPGSHEESEGPLRVKQVGVVGAVPAANCCFVLGRARSIYFCAFPPMLLTWALFSEPWMSFRHAAVGLGSKWPEESSAVPSP